MILKKKSASFFYININFALFRKNVDLSNEKAITDINHQKC